MFQLFVDWQPSPELFWIVKWYSLCWCAGLVGAYFIVRKLYLLQGIALEKYEPLFMYCFFGVLLGARLGHCIFYEPENYLTSVKGVVQMLLPIRFINDSWDWHFTGYTGLASHGGALGLAVAMWLYSKNYGIKLLAVFDNVSIAAAFSAGCIRIGNLMNSEIIGSTTDLPWGFIFHTNEALQDGQLVARHPSQLYEAIVYFIIFVFLWRWGKSQSEKKKGDGKKLCYKAGTGFYLGALLSSVFTFRFFVEFIKIEQVEFEKNMVLDMGQLLSIPFIIFGVFFVVRGIKMSRANA